MAHCIQAIVFRSGSIGGRVKAFPKGARVRLDQGIELLLQQDELVSELENLYSGKPTHLGGKKPVLPDLFGPFAALACDLSTYSKIGYIETDFFGGYGSQSAFLWEKGKVLYGPKTQTFDSNSPSPSQDNLAAGPINTVLRQLGAKRGGRIDEFEGVGLDRVRSVDG